MTWEITEWAAGKHWVTPKTARTKPVHRWYLFPHSFTDELVCALVDEWRLTQDDRILDPFVGSGTTLLTAKEVGVPGDGYDLSPLAVLASSAKTANYSRKRLGATWKTLERELGKCENAPALRVYPELVRKALPEGRLEALDAIAAGIENMECSALERDFFRLALMSVIPQFSHAVANGGWLRWLNQGAGAENVAMVFKECVERMLSDVRDSVSPHSGSWEARVADARMMPAADAEYSAVITSPPYPNRHDYTRIFGVELMFFFQDWETNRALRYQTFHSHPEARPDRPAANNYEPPKALDGVVRGLDDKRLKRMLKGYFLDMYLCLSEVARVCRKGAKVAFVLGNTRYNGMTVLVDEFTADIGEQVGLLCQEIRTVRWRGNSAQQMGRYGRVAARESIVMFEKP